MEVLLKRLIGKNPPLHLDAVEISRSILEGVDSTGSCTTEYLVESLVYRSVKTPEYGVLANRIYVDDLHRRTPDDLLEWADMAVAHTRNDKPAPLIDPMVREFISHHKDVLQSKIKYNRDYQFDYFALKTLERTYLLTAHGKVVERPQQMFMRVAIAIWMPNLPEVIRCYRELSKGYYIHATPTLINAGTLSNQLASCFLMQMKDDSIDGIYSTLKDCAIISKGAGGVAVNVTPIRAFGSYIKGTNGISNGLVPMLRVFNDTARYVDQGGGKRKGAFAVYLEPWHADIEAFVSLKLPGGNEELRSRDLFYGLWVPDLFMERVEKDQMWSLFCPHECPNLLNCYGKEFEERFLEYEKAGRYREQVKAVDLWNKILDAQIETGGPYILYKDACNEKSNQKNIGMINCSNLCTEIMEHTSKDQIAVCNLASLSLPAFVRSGVFDFQALYEVTYNLTKNMNRIIDMNNYPLAECERSNNENRPIGIGIQGLADTFIKLGQPFGSEPSKQLNLEMMETIYFAALNSSADLAIQSGAYSRFAGSPLSQGHFQFDLWKDGPIKCSKRWDWEVLRSKIITTGVRNSLLIALMPTASTSSILGNTECFEPITSNIYSRKVISGEFVLVNKHLMNDLIKLGLWNDELIEEIIRGRGSVQHIAAIPQKLKELYRISYEIPAKDYLEMAADRGVFVDQSQSMNLYLPEQSPTGLPLRNRIHRAHFYGFKKGLKTGLYYLRVQQSSHATQFGIEVKMSSAEKKVEEEKTEICYKQEGCLVCSSWKDDN